jgi:thiamine pyrophosphokinase
MAWLTALIKAILEWVTAEVKKDTKAGDADSVPQSLKDRWRDRINEQLEKEKKKNNNDKTSKNSSSNDSSD